MPKSSYYVRKRFNNIRLKFMDEVLLFAQIVSDFKNETTQLVKILTLDFDSKIAEYIKNI